MKTLLLINVFVGLILFNAFIAVGVWWLIIVCKDYYIEQQKRFTGRKDGN